MKNENKMKMTIKNAARSAVILAAGLVLGQSAFAGDPLCGAFEGTEKNATAVAAPLADADVCIAYFDNYVPSQKARLAELGTALKDGDNETAFLILDRRLAVPVEGSAMVILQRERLNTRREMNEEQQELRALLFSVFEAAKHVDTPFRNEIVKAAQDLQKQASSGDLVQLEAAYTAAMDNAIASGIRQLPRSLGLVQDHSGEVLDLPVGPDGLDSSQLLNMEDLERYDPKCASAVQPPSDGELDLFAN